METLTTASPHPAPLVCLAEFIASGELSGYVPGVPDPAPVVADLDRAITIGLECAHCGRRTISWRPFIQVRGDRVEYRGFARCRSCGHTEAL